MAKKFLLSIILFLIFPSIAFAAYNDVQFLEDTNVYLPGIPTTLTIRAGSMVASMTVYPDYISFGMEAGSSVTIVSPERRILTPNPEIAITNCGTAASVITLSSNITQTVTLTPTGFCPAFFVPTKPTTFDGEVTVIPELGGMTSLLSPLGSRLTVDFPENAVNVNTLVKIRSVSKGEIPKIPVGKVFVDAFDLTATPVSTFLKPVSLTFTYTDNQISGIDEESLNIFYYDGEKWVSLEGIVNPPINAITAQVNHFSYFAIFGESIVEVPIEELRAKQIAELKAQIAEIQRKIMELLRQVILILQAQIAELQAKLPK